MIEGRCADGYTHPRKINPESSHSQRTKATFEPLISVSAAPVEGCVFESVLVDAQESLGTVSDSAYPCELRLAVIHRLGCDRGTRGYSGGITGLTIKTPYSFYAGNVVRLGINGLEQM